MVYATCHNEDCEKDSWWLKKPPHEYASGGPKCPECGTTRVEIGDETESDPSASPDSGREPEARPAKTGSETPDTGMATQQDAIQTGAKVGEMVAGMGASTPEEKAETQGKLLTAVGSTVASLGQELADEKMENINRAKNADQSNLKAVEDYVSCPKCDTQITDLPPAGTKFRCPSCNELLESQ